jgi:hypothetical protein
VDGWEDGKRVLHPETQSIRMSAPARGPLMAVFMQEYLRSVLLIYRFLILLRGDE